MDIIQYNIRGLQNNRSDIDILKNIYNPSVFCLQETHIKFNNSPKFKNFNLINNLNFKATQGVAFLIKENIKFTQLPLTTNFQAIAIKLNIPYEVNICNLYIHPNENLIEYDFQQLLDQIPEPRIILGDFNAHNILWGSSKSNKRGKTLESSIINNHLMCINNINEFTYFHPSSGTATIIDLTLCNLNIAQKITWRTLEQQQSDHVPILISTKDQTISSNTLNETINYNNLNWNLFKSSLVCIPIKKISNIEDRIKSLSNAIKGALKSSQAKIVFNNKKTVPWWNHTLTKLRNEKNNAIKRFHKFPTSANREAFNICKRKFRNEIINQKGLHWSNYIESINDATNSRDFWYQIKKMNGNKTFNNITALNINGTIKRDPKVIANTLIESFANSNAEKNFKKRKKIVKTSKKINSCSTFIISQINRKISNLELERVLQATNNTSSPGFDLINYEAIKNLPSNYIDEIIDIYNTIFSEGTYPKFWKIAKVIPLLKPNSDQFEINSYRPISLLPCLSKLLEKILANRLKFWITEENLLSRNQMGFQKGLCTTDALVKLTEEVINDLNSKKHVDCIALDLTKAFDKCWPETIQSQLLHWGLTGNIFNLINSFLKNRKMMIHTSNMESKMENVIFGVPQGSPLSALLFIIAINDLSVNLSKIKNVKHTLFADDIIIYASFKKRKSNNIQKALNSTQNWCQKKGFQISSHKNQHIHFCRLNQCHRKSYNICNNTIITNPTLKYLGVTFDCKLNFIQHIESVKAKNLKNLNILRILASPKNGVNSSQLIKISNALIRSSLEYGCQVFSTTSKSNLDKFNSIYNSAIRISIGALSTSPISSIHAEANTYILIDRFVELNAKYFLKVKSNPNHINFSLINKLTLNEKRLNSGMQKTFAYLININLPIDDLIQTSLTNFPPWHNLNSIIDTDLSHQISKSDNPNQIKSIATQFLNEKYHSYLKIFTDGSKISNSTAYGIFSDHLNLNLKVKLNSESSIFEAESRAILKAISLIIKNQKTIILTDSLSAVRAIGSFKQSNFLINQIQSQLNLSQNIKIVWIPGHSGILGNEKADFLANKAHTNSNEILSSISVNDAFQNLKIIMSDIRENLWAKSTDKLKEIRNSLKLKSIIYRKLSRKDEVFLTRLRIGHTLDTHDYLFSNSPRPGCVFCQTVFTVKHILIDCNHIYRNQLKIDFNVQNSKLSDLLDRNTCNIELLKLLFNHIL